MTLDTHHFFIPSHRFISWSAQKARYESIRFFVATVIVLLFVLIQLVQLELDLHPWPLGQQNGVQGERGDTGEREEREEREKREIEIMNERWRCKGLSFTHSFIQTRSLSFFGYLSSRKRTPQVHVEHRCRSTRNIRQSTPRKKKRFVFPNYIFWILPWSGVISINPWTMGRLGFATNNWQTRHASFHSYRHSVPFICTFMGAAV